MVERKVQILSGFEDPEIPELMIYSPGVKTLSTLIPGYLWSGRIDSLLLIGSTKTILSFDIFFQDVELRQYAIRTDFRLPMGNQTINLISSAFAGNALEIGPETDLGMRLTNPGAFVQGRDRVTITGGVTEFGLIQGSPRLLPIEEGGTGVEEFPPNSLFVSNASGDLEWLAPGTDGQVLKSMGGIWVVGDP